MSSLRANILIQPQELYTSSSTQGSDLGAYATTGDGRYFRYALAGSSALVAGKLQQASAEDTTNLQNLAVYAAATAAVSVANSAAITLSANQVAGGLLVVTTNTGAGFSYKVKSHAAATAGTVSFNLEDALVQNVSTSSKIDLIPNIYSKVIVNPITATSAPVGVAVYNVTASQYGWIQVEGPCPVLADGALTVGSAVVPSTLTAGAVTVASSGTVGVVGYAVTGVATNEYGFVNLLL